MHPILDQPSFLSRCAEDLWQIGPDNPPTQPPRRRRHTDRFTAVYYAVAALGAIVAPEDALPVTTFRSSEKAHNSLGPSPHTSLAWAKTFFEKAQSNLGDVIQVCSLESTQALFLLVCYFCCSAFLDFMVSDRFPSPFSARTHYSRITATCILA